MTSGWTRSALRGALLATAITALMALSAGLVRLFPWLLDPSVTWRVATPFARSLSVVALEAAVALGWPLGWALGTLGFVERGEARVLCLLGERPARTVLRLGPQAVIFTALLGMLSWGSARESTEPGRIVSELIADGRTACARATSPRTYTVPFFGATWLCNPGFVPRLAGEGPGPLASVVFSARDARASGDLGNIELDDTHIALAGGGARSQLSLHVDALHLRGTAPWGHASTVTPLARALSLGTAVLFSALAAVALVLLHRAHGRLLTLATGSAGSLTALGLLRAAERYSSARTWLVFLVPLAALAAPLAVAWLGARLPVLWHTASKSVVGGLPPPKKKRVMGSIGPGELLLIAFVALLVFGAGRVADIGKGLGQGIRNFKEGLRDGGEDEPKKKVAVATEKKESEA